MSSWGRWQNVNYSWTWPKSVSFDSLQKADYLSLTNKTSYERPKALVSPPHVHSVSMLSTKLQIFGNLCSRRGSAIGTLAENIPGSHLICPPAMWTFLRQAFHLQYLLPLWSMKSGQGDRKFETNCNVWSHELFHASTYLVGVEMEKDRGILYSHLLSTSQNFGEIQAYIHYD